MIKHLQHTGMRSYWERGVQRFAIEMVEQYGEDAILAAYRDNRLENLLLNGAKDWKEFSYGGSWYVYDADIAEALCTPSELKRTRNGERNPNSRETWLDVQARALYQAYRCIWNVARVLTREA